MRHVKERGQEIGVSIFLTVDQVMIQMKDLIVAAPSLGLMPPWGSDLVDNLRMLPLENASH